MKKIILLCLGYSMTISLSALEISNLTTLSPKKEAIWASRAAINNQGAATVVWIKSHGQNLYSLQTSSRANSDSPWDQAQAISEPMNIFAYFPSVTVDGASTVVWSTDINMKQYYYTHKEKSSPWLHAQAIHHPNFSVTKDVIVDLKGDPFVLASSGESTIYSYHHKSNKQHTVCQKLPKSNEDTPLVPLLLKNPQGKIVALWSNEVYTTGYSYAKDYQFKGSEYRDNGTWNEKLLNVGYLNFTTLDKDKVTDISASLNSKSNIAVIWNHFDFEAAQHQLKTIVDSTYKIIRESRDGFTDSAIWMDGEGNAVAVWIAPFKKQNIVYAAFKPQNKAWQGVQELSNINNNAEYVQLSFSNGVFVAMWGEFVSAPFKRSICGATLTPKPDNAEWTPAVQLSPEKENCWYPSIAFGEKGGIITWTTHVKRSSDFQIQVANLIAP